MIAFIKKNYIEILSAMFGIIFTIICYGCEPKVKSLDSDVRLVNRQEFKIELDRLLALAELRLAQLDQQEQIRNLIFNNAISLAQGNNISPLGIITAIGAVYGFSSAAKSGSSALIAAIRKVKDSDVG
jgi:hypothetical protein